MGSLWSWARTMVVQNTHEPLICVTARMSAATLLFARATRAILR